MVAPCGHRQDYGKNMTSIGKLARDFVRAYYLALIIMLVCAVNQFFVTALRYDRALIGTEPWRLISAHFVHFGWPHYLMNMGALGLIWLIFAKRLLLWEWLCVLIGSAFLVSLILHFGYGQYRYYVGLSGVLHGLIAVGAWREWRFDKLYSGGVALGLCAKLGYEHFFGAMPGSAKTAGGPVLTQAHLFGAITALIIIILIDFWKRRAALKSTLD